MELHRIQYGRIAIIYRNSRRIYWQIERTSGLHHMFFYKIVSFMASILAYIFHNYAYLLHETEHQTLKAWLKNKDGRIFVEEMRAEDISSYAKRSEGIEFTRAGIYDLVTNIYFCINLTPALTATVLLLLVWLRPLPQ